MNRLRQVRFFVILVAALRFGAPIANATPPAATTAFDCVRWPEAEALFHRDPRWRGADGAASIDLGEGRVLWLFGDTFIAAADSPRRAGSTFLRNSVAIQTGYDPTTATFQPYFQTAEEAPRDFFSAAEGKWVWPGHGAMVDGRLLLFFMRAAPQEAWPKFVIEGWEARLVENPTAPPTAWRWRDLDLPPLASTGDVNLAASVLQDTHFVYAFGTNRSPKHSGIVLRWDREDVLEGDLTAPSFWNTTAHEWQSVPAPSDDGLTTLFTEAQEEYSVHYAARLKQFLQVQTLGFPLGKIAVRTADALTSSWSAPRVVHTPVETHWAEGTFVYSAKAHPEQQTDGLAMTYCTNTKNDLQVFSNESYYYPRFLKLRLKSATTDRDAPETP
ncbi:hypothetical protein Pla123a_31390 [Posidoniimonas polymericola]|uniref:DUF4185 domain-containing protein n=1 Tax=Posidoniimonas polymericola TaxID=2528002 RepID=A0A5C5YLE9_9BACT|nr:DUF4185 domain-containing protein [Posidoniimonas polymericola]TWT75629.1 hypothetical protein Pla123a_31390 [Posidoniimonas polymericola]